MHGAGEYSGSDIAGVSMKEMMRGIVSFRVELACGKEVNELLL